MSKDNPGGGGGKENNSRRESDGPRESRRPGRKTSGGRPDADLGDKPHLADRMRAAIRTHLYGDPRVEQVVLFGSRAKGNAREGSDIDLAVYGKELSQNDASRWSDELQEVLFPWSVDVVVIDPRTSAKLQAHIERVGIAL